MERNPDPDTERVPLFGTWRNAYAVVVIAFVVEVAFFAWFSVYFA